MKLYVLGYLMFVASTFDGTWWKHLAQGRVRRRENAVSSLDQMFHMNGWGLISTFAPEPEFVGNIPGIRVIAGKDAVLRCVVENLGNHKVMWQKVKKKLLLSMGTHVFVRNDRIQVTTTNFTSWYLHVKNVSLDDIGYYACQINTSPTKSQAGYLNVVEPPEFMTNHTSRNVTIMENMDVVLSCKATGNPTPEITWSREDGQPFLKDNELIREYKGEELRLTSVSRLHMAAYLCLASNQVPPVITRRINLEVQFQPLIWIPNQLVGARDGINVTLECHTEAHPTSDNYWLRDEEPVVYKSSRYKSDVQRNSYKTSMKLSISDLRRTDYGSYHCVAKNSISETRGSISLYRMAMPTALPPKPVTVSSPTYPTRRLITTTVSTDWKTSINDIERRENTNTPGKQQKYGDGRDDFPEMESSSQRAAQWTTHLLIMNMMVITLAKLLISSR
ncbi:lachesin-like [Uloborus diversus]|uniref:lachesin-like n=1 Tax=Uloborus diversus TaxID=327109 RepID=UPI00240927A1|nr:lachesin-like [Uloborus diversus]